MTTDGRDNEALVAFLKAVGLAIFAIDDPRQGQPSSEKFCSTLDMALAELPTLPGGAALHSRALVLREMLGRYVNRTRDIGAVQDAVNEIFRELDS